MKKILILILVTAFHFSCENSDIEIDNYEQEQIENVLALEGQNQRDAYVLLDNKLKYKLWFDKLNYTKSNLSVEQANAVDKLLTIIEPNFFEFENSKNSKYINRIEDWMLLAKKTFNKKEFILTFVTINNQRVDYDGGCACNRSEDYCWFSDCESSSCNSSYTGCGLLWNSTCNGECV
ncbi:MAG TPA: hypothetical protein DHV22_17790 [Xanthomarina gelatinilytica]|uniref:Bacteriocin fulvocin C-related protein n=1 Tax=Xanthomarina gelatinilytica TaxID=1137281 RepID=A0A3D6BVQ6_9FLAO|nr:hypothetical protein [Xanthomarina gelatinilytica]